MPKTLAAWLSYIEQIHPESIEMGLDRVRLVRDLMKIKLDGTVITVAGTNGKGSTAAMLTACCLQAGYRVGCYASPHFLRYNERLTINHEPVSDEAFCEAFEVVEKARVKASVALTYFEFGTLAAAWIMAQSSLDVAILEVGLGGRLDAVNIFDADCSIVTNIALDHQDFLGDTRESIAKEKAGVFRTGKPAICGDYSPPVTLLDYANTIGADLYCIGKAFTITTQGNGYVYRSQSVDNAQATEVYLPKIGLSGAFQANNAASAITAMISLNNMLPIELAAIQQGVANVSLTGRYERAHLVGDLVPEVVYDVAHNPNAAEALAHNLAADQHNTSLTLAVFSMLHNKDWLGVVRAVEPHIDAWYLGQIKHDRGANLEDLIGAISAVNADASMQTTKTISQAFDQALNASKDCMRQGKNVKIIVFGSFFTVSEVKHFLLENQGV